MSRTWTEYELLLACYRSGQVSERQWQEHLKDRAFRAWVEDQLPINCPRDCSDGDNPGQEGEGAAADQQGGGREATMADWTRHWKGGGNGAWIYRHPDATYAVVESPFGVFYRGKAFASVRDAQRHALGKAKAGP